MGNRGIIHDPSTRTLFKRRWTTRAWIICVCEFRNVRRAVMAQQSWTELFFFDEATALSAGHRPCFYCQRQRAKAFQAAWADGNDVARQSAPEMDRVLHGERLDAKGDKKRHPLTSPIVDLPDGSMIASGDHAYLVRNGQTSLWSWDGYTDCAPPTQDAALLTPPSIVRALLAGYKPAIIKI
jgi:hypothetical protein